MKILRCAALVVAVGLFSGVAKADEPAAEEGQISTEALAAVGLGQLEVMSEEESLQVRGRLAFAGGFAYTTAFFFPLTDSYFDAGFVAAGGSAGVIGIGQFAGGGSFAFGF